MEGSKAWVTLCSINNREKEKRSQLLQKSILYVYSLVYVQNALT